MINNAPRSNGKYKQGNYVPKNKMKVIKLNSKGGLYFRSSLEERMMIHLDLNPKIKKWGAECLEIPYTKKERDIKNGVFKTSNHRYYPDFYYEYLTDNNEMKRVVVEVKPHAQTQPPKQLKPNPTAKQLRNFEYSVKEYNRNLAKWTQVVEYCRVKGFEFVIITEEFFNRTKK